VERGTGYGGGGKEGKASPSHRGKGASFLAWRKKKKLPGETVLLRETERKGIEGKKSPCIYATHRKKKKKTSPSPREKEKRL